HLLGVTHQLRPACAEAWWVTPSANPPYGTVVSNYAPKLFGEPATATPPPVVTFITARPRSLVPSARKRNRPSMPAKPEGLVRTSAEKRVPPCVRASAATSATAS